MPHNDAITRIALGPRHPPHRPEDDARARALYRVLTVWIAIAMAAMITGQVATACIAEMARTQVQP